MSSETFGIEAQRTHYVHGWQKWPRGTERLCKVSHWQRRCTDADCWVAFSADRARSVRCPAFFLSGRLSAGHNNKLNKAKNSSYWKICACLNAVLYTCAVPCSVVCINWHCFLARQAPYESSASTFTSVLFKTCLSHITKWWERRPAKPGSFVYQ